MGEVKQLFGGVLPDIWRDTPNEDVIKMLKAMLADAKKGKLRCALVATVYEDGKVYTQWDGDQDLEPNMAKAMMVLNHRFATKIAEPGD
jgi:hypothetical protein